MENISVVLNAADDVNNNNQRPYWIKMPKLKQYKMFIGWRMG